MGGPPFHLERGNSVHSFEHIIAHPPWTLPDRIDQISETDAFVHSRQPGAGRSHLRTLSSEPVSSLSVSSPTVHSPPVVGAWLSRSERHRF